MYEGILLGNVAQCVWSMAAADRPAHNLPVRACTSVYTAHHFLMVTFLSLYWVDF